MEAVIERIRFSHATRKYKYPVILGREMIGQSVLAKMAGVSRQTIARWEELGFISRSDIGIPGEKYFVIEEVISQLGKLKGAAIMYWCVRSKAKIRAHWSFWFAAGIREFTDIFSN